RPWSPRSWRQALYLAGAVPALLLAVAVPVIRIGVQPHWSIMWHGAAGLLWVLWAVAVFLLAPAAARVHPPRLRGAAGRGRPPPPAALTPDHAGAGHGGPRAGDLAAARVPPHRRSRAGGGGPAGDRDMAGLVAVRVGVPVGLVPAAGRHAPAGHLPER